MARWQITIIIDEVNPKHDAKTLATEVKNRWMPVSHDYELVTISVGNMDNKQIMEMDGCNG